MKRGALLAAIAALLYALGVLLVVRADRRALRDSFPEGSIYATGDKGASLAFAYLRERLGKRGTVDSLHRRAEPGTLPARAVVFRLQPQTPPLLVAEEKDRDDKDSRDGKDKEKKKKTEKVPALLTPGEQAWVRGGGRLVIAFGSSYGPVETDELRPGLRVRKVFPLWPGVSRLEPKPARALDLPSLPGAHAVVLAGERVLAVRVPIGQGEVFLFATPEILENRGLGRAQHLALLEALAGGIGGIGRHRPVFFDERSHGLSETEGVLGTLAAWGLGPLLLLAALAGALAAWRASVRLGPPEREPREARSDAVELLDSLADLYDRALHRGDAARLYHESFVHGLAVESGLRGAALDARARDLLGGWAPPPPGTDLSREPFERALRTINQAFRRLHDAKRK